jgi:pimeloyl-ACP methyl ester carboxylesterase
MGILKRALKALVQPPRKTYRLESMPLEFTVPDFGTFRRYPVSFTNRRGQRLVGSIFHSIHFSPFQGGPCVVYLHGSASSQLEGQFLVPNLCPYGLFVVCFDFAGCGMSDGDYVSLGKFEHEDAEFVVNSLHRTFNFGPFVFWGRSMGAAAALLADHPRVVGRVCDSTFTSVVDLCRATAERMHLAQCFMATGLWYLRKKILARAKFDISEVAPIEIEGNGEIPALFGHAEADEFFPFEQGNRVYEHYACAEKSIVKLPGGHNSVRDGEWILMGIDFCLRRFGLEIPDPQVSLARNVCDGDPHSPDYAAMIERGEIVDELRIKWEDEIVAKSV